MSYGQKSAVALIMQNSYGTVGDVSSAYFIPFTAESLKINKPPLYSENMRGIFDEGDTYEGANTVDGSIESEAQPIALGAMLKTVLDHSVSAVDSVFEHTFKPRSSDFDENCANQPVTAYVYRDTGSADIYANLNGAMLELGIANGEFLRAKVDFVGGTFSQQASTAASFPVGKRWTWAVTSVSLGGSAIDDIVNLTITLDDGALEASHTLNNSLFPSRIKRTGFRTIAVDGTFKFDNQDEYQQFLSQSERELVLTFTGPTEISSGHYEVLTIKLPLLRYEAANPNAGGPGEIEMPVTARGKYSVESGTSMQITLTNTQATY